MSDGQEIFPGVPAPGIYERGALDFQRILGSIIGVAEDSMGAVMTYVGRVKSPGLDGREVRELTIESDKEDSTMALRRMCAEVKEKYGLQLTVVYQYEGSFQVGDLLVMVAVVGKARPETFAALEEAVRRFKPEANLRKKEVYDGGQTTTVVK